MKLFIVGKVNERDHKKWEFQGVFDNEKTAMDRCEDRLWFVAPINLNEYVPTKPTKDWPGAYFPLEEEGI